MKTHAETKLIWLFEALLCIVLGCSVCLLSVWRVGVFGGAPPMKPRARRTYILRMLDTLNSDPGAVRAVSLYTASGMSVNSAVTRVALDGGHLHERRVLLERGILKIGWTGAAETHVLVDTDGVPYAFELRDNQVILRD